mmetsp:Transcript_91480/g.279959  ORF Transcript_91480/g.279959 Transcript_91480/m.279959 type:complete len:275 (-) Transcript_91480:42-866(-)
MQVEERQCGHRRAKAVPRDRQRRGLRAADGREALFDAPRQRLVVLQEPLAHLAGSAFVRAPRQVCGRQARDVLHPPVHAGRATEGEDALAMQASDEGVGVDRCIGVSPHVRHPGHVLACAALPGLQGAAVAVRRGGQVRELHRLLLRVRARGHRPRRHVLAPRRLAALRRLGPGGRAPAVPRLHRRREELAIEGHCRRCQHNGRDVRDTSARGHSAQLRRAGCAGGVARGGDAWADRQAQCRRHGAGSDGEGHCWARGEGARPGEGRRRYGGRR